MKPTFFSKLPTDLKLVCVEEFRCNGSHWRSALKSDRRFTDKNLSSIRTCDVRDYLPIAEQLAKMKAERAQQADECDCVLGEHLCSVHQAQVDEMTAGYDKLSKGWIG